MPEISSTNPLTGFLAGIENPEAGCSTIDSILEAVRNHLGMEIAFAARYVGDERQFTHISSAIPVPSAPGDREPADRSYCYHVLHGRLPELIQNAGDLEFASTLPITAALPVGAHITVPLRFSDGSLYGSFCCLSRDPDYSLTARDLATVRAFAELAGRQIERERKGEETKLAWRARVEEAIAEHQPVIHLQPIHRLSDGRTVGAEALARFPDARDRPPNLWFDEAGEVGLGLELELAAVRQALAVLAYVPSDQYLSVNVSPETILSGAVEPLVRAASGRALVLEITEHKQVKDIPELKRQLARLRPHARIAIDDVGAGYAGLQHIIAFEPDILKLDLSLTRDIDRDSAKRALTAAMVGFASLTGSVIVAEGVEREGERKVLEDLGLLYGQGWLFSRAMPVVKAQQLMLGVGTVPASPARPEIDAVRNAAAVRALGESR
ncbi:MAG TPA: EAL domain-containing protein [Allosphingosinicella sp.]|nr:EAL domain-containing protein [Allosphingosinicella sp.]